MHPGIAKQFVNRFVRGVVGGFRGPPPFFRGNAVVDNRIVKTNSVDAILLPIGKKRIAKIVSELKRKLHFVMSAFAHRQLSRRLPQDKNGVGHG